MKVSTVFFDPEIYSGIVNEAESCHHIRAVTMGIMHRAMYSIVVMILLRSLILFIFVSHLFNMNNI